MDPNHLLSSSAPNGTDPAAVPNAASAPATSISAAVPITLTIHGTAQTLTLPSIPCLFDLPRDHLRLTGREGCGKGRCAARAVLRNGNLVNVGLLSVRHADGTGATNAASL